MKKIFALGLFVLGLAATLAAAKLSVYNVPDLPGGNEKPSIARNHLGDMLIVYRNNNLGAAYYYQRHDNGGTIGPAIIPGQDYDPEAKHWIWVTDIEPTPDGNFHVVWNFDIHMGKWGMYYTEFNVQTEKWSKPEQIEKAKIECPKLTVNPLNNDLLLVYDAYLSGINKDVFLKVKTAEGWQTAEDISYTTQPSGTDVAETTAINGADGDGLRREIQAPHGNLAETNAWVAVDESDGYVYMCWKSDKWNEEDQAWELMIVVALLSPNYHRVWYGYITIDYWGFHMIPTIVAKDGRAMVAFAWKPLGYYYYVTFQREQNELIYNPNQLQQHRIAPCPMVPHWEFFSVLLSRTNEALFTYKDLRFRINLLRYTIDGKRLDENPADLCNEEPSLWPYDTFSDPSDGLLTVWATREDVASIHYSIYDLPAQITLTSPNGGEVWEAGSGRDITWKSSGLTGKLDIILLHGEQIVGTLARDVDVSDGSFNWQVAEHEGGMAASGSAYRIRLQHAASAVKDDSDGYFSIVSAVKSPINLAIATKLERSFFKGYYINVLSWENNPYNITYNIPIVSHRIYRKPQGQGRSAYARIGEVTGTTFSFMDADQIGPSNTYDYAVTCVDNEGNESDLL